MSKRYTIPNISNRRNYRKSDSNETTAKERVLMKYIDIAIENREFEIRHYWIRTAFFGGVVAIAFTGLTSKDSANTAYWRTLISSIGLICSFCWILANLGSKYWQKNWEKKADILTDDYFSTIEIKEDFSITGGMRFSVSKLITLLSYYICLCWYCLLIYFSFTAFSSSKYCFNTDNILTLAGLLGTHITLGLIAWLARSGKDTIKDNNKSKRFKKIGSLLNF